jgi:signal transduction histidine kinase
MRLSTLLGAFTAILLTGAIASAGLTYFAVTMTRAWDERIALAYESYSQHLELEANLFRLFKENADALLIGDRDFSATEQAVVAAINENLSNIRAIISREIEIDGEEEYEELELLASLERRIDDILRRYDALLNATPQSGDLPVAELVPLLDRDIDSVLSDLIDVALAGEREEVESTERAAESLRDVLITVALTIVVVMIAVTLLVGLVYRRQAARPFASLMRGVSAIRRGDYDQTITPAGTIELRTLSETISDMAHSIAERERDLTGQARELEARVAERTSELQTVLTRLEQAEASRRQMMADVSHELRTPLTIIQGEADVALRSGAKDTDQAVDTFGRIRDAARLSNRIVDDLLLIAREESGQLRLDLRNVDLNAALIEGAKLAQADIDVADAGSPIPYRVDPLRLRQCLLAIMNNSIRYGGKHIRAWIERVDSGIEIIVSDDGPGMSPSEKDQAFERFFRGSDALGTGVEGTGLGLPIVRSIMKAHGGTVDLLDSEGGGLTVKLKFPSTLRPVPSETPKQSSRRA